MRLDGQRSAAASRPATAAWQGVYVPVPTHRARRPHTAGNSSVTAAAWQHHKRLHHRTQNRAGSRARSATRPAALLKSLFKNKHETAEASLATSAAETLQLQQPKAPGSTGAPPAPLLSGSGGGIFFFWQAGVVKYIAERYDLTHPSVHFLGASAGSLLVVLAACGVSADDALAGAHKLALEHNIFDRPLGVAGIWGDLIRRWLDDLLPDNALDMCRDRVRLIVTEVPSLRQTYLEEFKSRDDLLDAAMASSHIPFLLDWRLTAHAGGKRYVDGSFRDFVEWKNSDLLTCHGAAFVVDYSQDENLKAKRLEFVSLKQYEEVVELMEFGYQFAKRKDLEGILDAHFGIAKKPAEQAAADTQQQPSAMAAVAGT